MAPKPARQLHAEGLLQSVTGASMATASGCSVRKWLVCHPIHRSTTDCWDRDAFLGTYRAVTAVPRSASPAPQMRSVFKQIFAGESCNKQPVGVPLAEG